MSDDKSEGFGGLAVILAVLAAIFLITVIMDVSEEKAACRWTLTRYAKTPAESLAVLRDFPTLCPSPKGLKP